VITFLDWALGLPDDLAADIDAEIAVAEGKTMAQLMTRWERQGWERGVKAGLEQGRVRGQQELLLRMPERKFGALDGSARERLGTLSGEQLVAPGDALFNLATHGGLDCWLVAHAPVVSE
jgi:hypothetical protein